MAKIELKNHKEHLHFKSGYSGYGYVPGFFLIYPEKFEKSGFPLIKASKK